MASVEVTLTVIGETVVEAVEPRTQLADFLRDQLFLTGTHIGCEHGVCGACTVRIDGEIVRSCLTLAVQADGYAVETIKSLSDSGEIADFQQAFREHNALQCAYCTPGMLIASAELRRPEVATPAEIRSHLSGNYCRCTGWYQAIVDAVEATTQRRVARA